MIQLNYKVNYPHRLTFEALLRKKILRLDTVDGGNSLSGNDRKKVCYTLTSNEFKPSSYRVREFPLLLKNKLLQ